MCAWFVEASSYENNTSCFFETFGNRLCTAFSKACDMLDKTNAELQLLFSSLLLSFSKISGLAIQISTRFKDNVENPCGKKSIIREWFIKFTPKSCYYAGWNATWINSFIYW